MIRVNVTAPELCRQLMLDVARWGS